jgi:hypothetical protein
MSEVLFSLILWISQQSTFTSVPMDQLPDVNIVDQPELVEILFKGNLPASLTTDQYDHLLDSVQAVYNNDENAVYVSERVDLASADGRAVLLHELVHYVQYATGVDQRVDCQNALEEDAYELQRVFMEERGLEPEFDRFTVMLRSTCNLH